MAAVDCSNNLKNMLKREEDDRVWLEPFRQSLTCTACKGSRLRPEALSIRMSGKSIFDICFMSLADVEPWFENLQFSSTQQLVARPILSDMLHRLRFLNKVGLGYLTLSRVLTRSAGVNCNACDWLQASAVDWLACVTFLTSRRLGCINETTTA